MFLTTYRRYHWRTFEMKTDSFPTKEQFLQFLNNQKVHKGCIDELFFDRYIKEVIQLVEDNFDNMKRMLPYDKSRDKYKYWQPQVVFDLNSFIYEKPWEGLQIREV